MRRKKLRTHRESRRLRGLPILPAPFIPRGVFPLLSLPPELILIVASFLRPDDALSLYRASPSLAHLTSALIALSRRDVVVGTITYSPLQFFVSRRVPHIVTHLLKSGVDPNAYIPYPPHSQLPPLLYAIAANSPRLCALLLQHGAGVKNFDLTFAWMDGIRRSVGLPPCDPNAAPLEYAVRMRPPNPKIIKLLLDAGAVAQLEDLSPYNRKTPLMTACTSGEVVTDVVKTLLAAGADPNTRGPHGATPLIEICQSKVCEIDVIEALLAAGADANAHDEHNTPLLSLCQSQQPYSPRHFELLLAAGADPKARDEWKRTALHGVCYSQYCSIPILNTLITAGADINALDGQRSTPLLTLCSNHEGPSANIQVLIDAGADVNARDSQTLTPLLKICGSRVDTTPSIQTLLAAGADVHATTCASNAYPYPHLWPRLISAQAIHVAAHLGNIPVIRTLLAAGADVNARVKGGASALHCAMVKRNRELVEVLLEAGADTKAVTTKGEGAALWIDTIYTGHDVGWKAWLNRCEAWGIAGVEEVKEKEKEKAAAARGRQRREERRG